MTSQNDVRRVEVDDRPTQPLNPTPREQVALQAARDGFEAMILQRAFSAPVVYPTHSSFPSVEHQDLSLMTRATRLLNSFSRSSPT